jgi:lysophospholipase L1-like esterase
MGILAWFFLGLTAGRAALEDEVRAYEAQDAAQAPPAGATLFVGSSSIRGWTNLAASFPGRTVLNRGFGGSQMSDLLAYFDRLVVPYRPPLMVVYEGDNDLASAKTVAQVFADYVAFAARVEHRLPATEVVFLAVKPSPSRAAYMPKFAEFNALLKAFCAGNPHFRFVDVYTPMLNDQGQPRPELFQSDQLHMVAAGYALWTSVIAPVLDEAPFLPARRILVDFGAATATTVSGAPPADPVNAWNNVTAAIGGMPGGRLDSLRAVDGTFTPFGMVIDEPFAGANEAGVAASPLFPENAGKDSLFGHAGEFDGRSNVRPGFRLTGLNRDAAYHLTFFASRAGVTDVRETVYTVTGESTQTATLDASNNGSQVASVGAVVPDPSGEVTIRLDPGPANTSPQQFSYLGVLRLEERPPPAPVAFLEEPQDRTVESGQGTTFSAVVTGAPPLSFQWFQDGVAIPDATGSEHRLPAVTAALDGARFWVRVSNAGAEVVSRQALLTVVADTTAPAALSAGTTDGVTIAVEFSEALDPSSLAPLSHYAVHGGLVPVLTASLLPDGRTLVLTLAHRVGGQVPIRLSGVRDLAGNMVAANAAVTVTAPVREPLTCLFDFGAAGSTTGKATAPANDPARMWNNVTGIGLNSNGRLDTVVGTGGEATRIGLVMLSRFNGVNENGTTVSTEFPVNATRDSLYGNTETFNGLQNVFPRFKLTGLDPGTAYTFTFFASRTGVGDNRETGYTVAGATTEFTALNAANNVAATAEVSRLHPTSEGEVTISLAPTPANTNANHFTYLGVLQVRSAETTELATPLLLTPSTLVIDWTGNGVLEWSENLSPSEWHPITPAPVAPWFEDISRSPRRFYRLRPAP